MSNTFLLVSDNMTLKDLSSYVGSSAVNSVLNLNNLERKRDISGQVDKKFKDIVSQNTNNVSWKRKQEILNIFSTDSDVFEYAATQSEDGWKILDSSMTFYNALAIPETVEVVKYDDVLGNGKPVQSDVYKNVMNSLEAKGTIDTSVFNDFSTIKPSAPRSSTYSNRSDVNGIFQSFNIPWGDITFYSSLSGSSVDIPAYPESIKDPRMATYVTMPDTLYQYEPWYTYSNSGPREVTFEFHLHRQMWTGNETDGQANQMIRFIQASTYPRYKGSSVVSDVCTLYIKGSPYIRGIVTSAEVEWLGPIGIDGYYLEFNLAVTFVEISNKALNYDVVKSMPLIG